MLKIKPIKNYRSPVYPEQKAVLENPDILKTLPQRWKGKAFAGLAFSSIALVLLSGCEKPIATAGTPKPPPFLNEEEAYNIIIDEAAKYGVILDKEGLELKDVEFQLDKGNKEGEAPIIHKHTVQLDGYDEKKMIGFEYVSFDDINEFNTSIKEFNSQGVYPLWVDVYGDKLEQGVKAKDEEMYFDVFYSKGYENEEMEKNLREQVKSFMEWLKTQGVI